MNTFIRGKYHFKKLIIVLLGLLCLTNPKLANAQNDIDSIPSFEITASSLYDSICAHINRDDTELAKNELQLLLTVLEPDEDNLRFKSHVILINLAIAEKNYNELNNELSFFETADTTYRLSVCFSNPDIGNDIDDDIIRISKSFDNSAWIFYDTICTHVNKGDIELAKNELQLILDGLDNDEFVECTNSHIAEIIKYRSHIILANLAIAENRFDDLCKELLFFENSDAFGLPICFIDSSAIETIIEEEEVQVYSAWALYDSVCEHINIGEVDLAESELRTILNDLDEGLFVECSNEHTVRLLQYKAHIILANIAYANKSLYHLQDELSFFKNADTTKVEWRRARYAEIHFQHKYYQLVRGRYGKFVGDWVSFWKNGAGYPMIWIKVYLTDDNTIIAVLQDCAMKTLMGSKYEYDYYTNKIVLDNVQNIMEINFGNDKIMPGLQFLPSAAIKTINDLSDINSEAIARQSITKYGTPYTSEAMVKQLTNDMATLLASALIAQLSVTKETVTAESFVMEQIESEIYMAKVKLRVCTAWSDGRYKDELQWAEIPVFHLYPKEEKDFSPKNFKQSIIESYIQLSKELYWKESEENDYMATGIMKEMDYSYRGVCNVEHTQYIQPFYFLGENINAKYATTSFFSGLALSSYLWGFNETPINPLTNKSEINYYITPLRGVFKVVISPTEYITFTGDWNHWEKCGNGVLCYVNTTSPDLSFTYEGTIMKGYPHGLGIWHGPDFSYVGWFFKGKRFGYGTMTYNDGHEEQGFFLEDGRLIYEQYVTEDLKKEFNNKVKKVSKHKYQILDE